MDDPRFKAYDVEVPDFGPVVVVATSAKSAMELAARRLGRSLDSIISVAPKSGWSVVLADPRAATAMLEGPISL